MTNFDTHNKLFSYFIVMGVDAESEDISYQKIHEGKVIPKFLDVYPPFMGGKTPQSLHKYEMFGFHDGFKICDENLKLLYHDQFLIENSANSNEEEKAEILNEHEKTNISEQIHSFIMTDGESNRKYCTAILFYEKYYIKNDQQYCKKEKNSTLMPKTSLQDLIKYPYTMNDYSLVYLPKSISLISPIACFETQRQILNYLYISMFAKRQENVCTREIRIPKFILDKFQTSVTMHQGDHDFDEFWYNQCLSLQSSQKNLATKDYYSIKESQLKEFYISVMFSLMEVESFSIEKVLLDVYQENSEEKEFARYRITNSKGNDLPSTDYRYLFQKISVENILQLFKCLIMERQIIIFSTTPGNIPYIGEALLGLLGPLKWCCMYVPFFPICLWEHLHALMPYIVGMDSKHKQFIASRIDLTDKVVVDLDTNSIYLADNIPDLPPEINNYLTTKLKELFNKIQSNTSNSKLMDGVWADATLRIRHYFGIAFLAMTNNYLPFFYLPKDFDPEIKYSASDVFDSEKYFSHVSDKSLPFIQEMHNTMMFTNFLAETFDILYIYEPRQINPNHKCEEVALFISKIREIKKFVIFKPDLTIPPQTLVDPKSDQGDQIVFFNCFHPSLLAKLNDMDHRAMKEALGNYLNPVKISLFPYLVKYYYLFFSANKDINLSASIQFSQTEEGLKPGMKKPTHARHTSLASLISLKDNNTKTINKSWQNFSSLSLSKVVNLNRMFGKPNITNRRAYNKSMGIIQEVTNNLAHCTPKFGFDRNFGSNPSRYDKGKLGWDSVNDPQDQNDDIEMRKGSTIIHSESNDTKPEIVKKVLQKLESDDFVFKPNPRKKSVSNIKLNNGLLRAKQTQINETDEFALEEAEKVRNFSHFKENNINQT